MEKEKFNIVLFSGDMDKVLAAFILATTAASMDMEVSMFFTFWGLNVLRKKKAISGKTILQKIMNFINKGGVDRLPSSKFNMLGMGPAAMKIMMKQTNIPDVKRMLEVAKEFGVKFIVCTTTFGFMGFSKEDFIDGVDSFVGAAAFLAEAKEGKLSYFI